MLPCPPLRPHLLGPTAPVIAASFGLEAPTTLLSQGLCTCPSLYAHSYLPIYGWLLLIVGARLKLLILREAYMALLKKKEKEKEKEKEKAVFFAAQMYYMIARLCTVCLPSRM